MVSIPFKRESVSKGSLSRHPKSLRLSSFNSLQTGKCIQSFERNYAVAVETRFNSLQTGKCIQRTKSSLGSVLRLTPIRFNSLQTGKCIQRLLQYRPTKSATKRFNSLQTGKCIQRDHGTDWICSERVEFQFPSNGKVYPKGKRERSFTRKRRRVSIPFKRESVSKGL